MYGWPLVAGWGKDLAMHRSLSLAFSILVATACSSTEQTTSAPLPSAEPPIASQTASTQPSAAPTVGPARPAPAAGTERLVFDLSVLGEKGKVAKATLDLPGSLAIELSEHGEAEVATCRAASSLGTEEMKSLWMRLRGVSLHALGCAQGKTPKACLMRAIEADEGETDVKWTGETRAARFGSHESKGGNKYAGIVAFYDPETNSAVKCSFDLDEDGSVTRARETYQSICDSLGPADASAKKAVTRNATMTDAEREDLHGVPEPEKLKATVEGFFVALGKRDIAAAKKLVLGPNDCKMLLEKAPPGKKKMGLAGCKKEMKESVDSLTLEVAKEYPENFELAAIRLARGDGMTRLKSDADQPVYEVLVTQKGKECTVELPVFVGKFADDYRILVARKAAEPKEGKSGKGNKKKSDKP